MAIKQNTKSIAKMKKSPLDSKRRDRRVCKAVFLSSFWEHSSVEELAITQGIGPISNLDMVTGGWPGKIDDGFEEWIAELRQSEMINQ